MREVHIILTLPKQTEEAKVNVVDEEPGPANLIMPYVHVGIRATEALWKLVAKGEDELDALAQAAFELGRKFERGEYDTLIQ